MSAVPASILNTEALYVAVDRRRRERKLSHRKACADAGLPIGSRNLFTGLRRGDPPSLENFLRLLLWLGETDIRPYLLDGES